MPIARTDAERSLAALRTGVTRLADALFELDTAPEFALVRDSDALAGRSRTVAGEATARLRSLWERYPVLTGAVDRLEEALRARRSDEVERLLGPGAVELPDGSRTSPAALLTALQRDLDAAGEAARTLAGAWRDVVPRLDRAAATLATVEARAADLGLTGPERDYGPDLVQARSLLDGFIAQAAADPLGVDPGPAERAVERVQQRIGSLVEQRASLPADLAEARRTVQELAAVIAQGRDAGAATRSRIADPPGLLEPLDAGVLDRGGAGGQPLRPWLARLEADAAAGNWTAAAPGLARWQEAAAELGRRARAVLAANRAPLDRRNELRGLLDAFRAKAGAMGRAESPVITRRYRAARDALSTAPCDLDVADARVQEFVAAVNNPEPEDR